MPTPPETGLKDADSAIWFGVFMPAKTPRDIVEKFHAAGAKVLADPAMQDSLSKLGVETDADDTGRDGRPRASARPRPIHGP